MKRYLSSFTIIVSTLLTLSSPQAKRGLFSMHTRLGKKYYSLKKYREAAEQFEAALKVRESASAHFNLAQCYRFLKDYGKAIHHYEAFLKRIHTLKQFSRQQINAFTKEVKLRISRLTKLQQGVDDGKKTILLFPKPVPGPHPPAPLLKRWPFWAIAGVGAAALVATVVFGIKALEKRDEWETYWLPSMERDMERYRNYADLSLGLLALSAVSMGFYLYAIRLEKRKHVQPLKDRQLTVIPQAGMSQVGLSLIYRF